MRSLIVGLCCLIVSTNVTTAQDAAKLAKAAQAVLKDRCFSCHGESGANEGGFNYALNRKRLVRELVVPGSADESKLLQRVIKGEMPPVVETSQASPGVAVGSSMLRLDRSDLRTEVFQIERPRAGQWLSVRRGTTATSEGDRAGFPFGCMDLMRRSGKLRQP